MTIPQLSQGAHEFWEGIDGAREASRIVSGRVLRFFVQPTRADCVYACTVDDIARLMSHVPMSDWEGLQTIVLRQGRRKEQMLAPVWGRLAYFAELVNRRGHVVHCGPAIIVEAVNPTKPLKYGRNLSPDDINEWERLIADGNKMRRGDKNHTIEPTLESCRATQLYRTIPHELGHWVDFLEKVERPSAMLDGDEASGFYGELLDRFHSRASREREHFAHAYAQRLCEHLRAIRAIPFHRVLDHEQIVRDDLHLKDFLFS